MDKPTDEAAEQVSSNPDKLALRVDYLYFSYQVLHGHYPALALKVYRTLLAGQLPLPPKPEDSQCLVNVNLNDIDVRSIIDALSHLMAVHQVDQQPSVQALYQDVLTAWLLLARALLLIVLEQQQASIH